MSYFGRSRDEVMAALAEQGIETRPFFIPLHMLPPFREITRARCVELSITEELGRTGINLPTYSTMTVNAVERVIMAIKSAAR